MKLIETNNTFILERDNSTYEQATKHMDLQRYVDTPEFGENLMRWYQGLWVD